MRHTFISVGLTNGVNPKWLKEYCGTSIAMIEKHYGKYMKNDSAKQLSRLLGAKIATSSATFAPEPMRNVAQVAGEIGEKGWWRPGGQCKEPPLRGSFTLT
jgi:hypothetical protein